MWRDNLPGVGIYYSFKTNSDPELIKTMLAMGTDFDCASKGEIKAAIKLGVKPENILYANPCKPESHILYAKQAGVKIMTFDCAEEAEKIHSIYPEAELILRITVDDRNAADPMSGKFGAKENQWSPILETCKRLKMRLRGVSFHVGSGGCSFNEYRNSIINAQTVFEMAKNKGMKELDILDIGGGFSMSSTDPERNFDFVAPKINQMLKEYFPGTNNNIKVVGEPGRFISQDAMSVVV
jgi:ornithine decarboxylase